jgi:RNA polymerase sigma factor (sigma-70 family)
MMSAHFPGRMVSAWGDDECEGDVTAELIRRTRAGNHDAFTELVAPYRAELQAHCYRMLGSLQDSEDLLQETLLAAWLGLEGFEQRSSVRTWLYRIASNRCLNHLRSAKRRPAPPVALPAAVPEPTRTGEVFWLQPCPDTLLEGFADRAPGPEARYESREAISLAFVTVVQLLPPNQRAVLLLRDVLGYRRRGRRPARCHAGRRHQRAEAGPGDDGGGQGGPARTSGGGQSAGA